MLFTSFVSSHVPEPVYCPFQECRRSLADEVRGVKHRAELSPTPEVQDLGASPLYRPSQTVSVCPSGVPCDAEKVTHRVSKSQTGWSAAYGDRFTPVCPSAGATTSSCVGPRSRPLCRPA